MIYGMLSSFKFYGCFVCISGRTVLDISFLKKVYNHYKMYTIYTIMDNTLSLLYYIYYTAMDCRIHRPLPCLGVRPPQRVSWFDTKQSDGEVPGLQELWGMQSSPSMPSLTGPLWPGMVAPDRVLSMIQIELNCVRMINWIVWNRSVFDIEPVFLRLTELFEIGLNKIVRKKTVLTFNSVNKKKKLYLY